MIRHRYEQALALAERSVALHEQFRPATTWPCRSRHSGRSASALGRCHARTIAPSIAALDVRRGILFHETTGAIFDSLAQIHLVRGDYDQARGFAREGTRGVWRLRRAHPALVRLVAAAH